MKYENLTPPVNDYAAGIRDEDGRLIVDIGLSAQSFYVSCGVGTEVFKCLAHERDQFMMPLTTFTLNQILTLKHLFKELVFDADDLRGYAPEGTSEAELQELTDVLVGPV